MSFCCGRAVSKASRSVPGLLLQKIYILFFFQRRPSETKSILVCGRSGHLNASNHKDIIACQHFWYQSLRHAHVGKILLYRAEPECQRFGLRMELREAFSPFCPPLCFLFMGLQSWISISMLYLWGKGPWGVVEGWGAELVWDYRSVLAEVLPWVWWGAKPEALSVLGMCPNCSHQSSCTDVEVLG